LGPVDDSYASLSLKSSSLSMLTGVLTPEAGRLDGLLLPAGALRLGGIL
jgi:hypothetical protein